MKKAWKLTSRCGGWRCVVNVTWLVKVGVGGRGVGFKVVGHHQDIFNVQGHESKRGRGGERKCS